MATINWQVEKETFIPEKNYFKTEWVRISREETAEELELDNKRYKWERLGFLSLFLGMFGGFILTIVFGVIGSYSGNPWFHIGTAIGIAMIFGSIFLTHGWFWEKEKEAAEAMRSWYEYHEKELWAEAMQEVDTYNEEQHRIAEAWRAEHPLEEKIRACLLDPKSSVDIANLARYYAEEYLEEKSNERSKTVL